MVDLEAKTDFDLEMGISQHVNIYEAPGDVRNHVEKASLRATAYNDVELKQQIYDRASEGLMPHELEMYDGGEHGIPEENHVHEFSEKISSWEFPIVSVNFDYKNNFAGFSFLDPKTNRIITPNEDSDLMLRSLPLDPSLFNVHQAFVLGFITTKDCADSNNIKSVQIIYESFSNNACSHIFPFNKETAKNGGDGFCINDVHKEGTTESKTASASTTSSTAAENTIVDYSPEQWDILFGEAQTLKQLERGYGAYLDAGYFSPAMTEAFTKRMAEIASEDHTHSEGDHSHDGKEDIHAHDHDGKAATHSHSLTAAEVVNEDTIPVIFIAAIFLIVTNFVTYCVVRRCMRQRSKEIELRGQAVTRDSVAQPGENYGDVPMASPDRRNSRRGNAAHLRAESNGAFVDAEATPGDIKERVEAIDPTKI